MHHTGMRFVPAEIEELLFHAIVALAAWAVFGFLLNRNPGLAIGGFLLLASVRYASGAFFRGHPIFGQTALRSLLRPLFDDMVFPQGMYFVVAAFAVIVIVHAVIRRSSLPAAILVTIAMALPLALRVMVEIHIQDYAIYSSSLLFVAFMASLWSILDQSLSRFKITPVAIYFAVYAVLFVKTTLPLYSDLPWPVLHTPVGDVRRTPENVTLMTQFLPLMQQAKSRGERVMLLPEVTGLYFLSGMLAPTRNYVITPGILEPGKYTDFALHLLEQNPPDLIILTNRRTKEYGADYFGLDYDQPVLDWINSRYKVSGEIGHFERAEGAPLSALMFSRRS
jgi:hypothetical protein